MCLSLIARARLTTARLMSMQKSEELIGLGITGPEGHAMCRAEEIESEAAHRAIVLANQARCPLSIVPVTSKSSAKVISEARHKGTVCCSL